MKGLTYLMISALSFGSVGILRKLISSDVPTTLLSPLRMFFAFITIFVLIKFTHRENELYIPKKDLMNFILLGLCMATGVVFYLESFVHAPVNEIAMISFMSPVVIAVLASFFLNEKITRYTITAIILTLIGSLIVTGAKFSIENAEFLGLTLSFFSVITFSIYNTGIKFEEKKYKLTEIVFWPLLFSAIFLLPLGLLESSILFDLEPIKLFLIVLLGVLTGVAFASLDMALESMQAHTASILFTSSSAIVSVVLAVLLLSERIEPNTIFGGFFLFCAAYVISHESKRKSELKRNKKHKRHVRKHYHLS